MRWSTVGWLAAAALLSAAWESGAAGAARAAALAQAAVPRFETAECPFPGEQIPAGERVECGYLVVLEDRARPEGRTLRLAVAILKSYGADPAPDPVVFLSGGPGLPALQDVNFWLATDRSLRARRDLILFDQRGTGYSEPDMRCPELDEPAVAEGRANLPLAEASAPYVAAALRCRDRLASAGVDLAAYHSSASAADLAELRQALGYAEWNLYGFSYGGRLALTTLREQPDGIRAVVLDSPRTVGVRTYEARPADTARGFQALFDGCAADADCRRAFPDPAADLAALVARLNASPASVAVADPATGAPRQQRVNGDQIISGGFQALYDVGLIPVLPLAIDQINRGNQAVLQGFAGALGQGSSASAGMTLSVLCREEVPFNDEAALRAAAAEQPLLESYLARYELPDFEICAAWGAGRSPAAEDEPVRSDVPALIVTGEYDPIHPAWWGQLAADNLSNSYHYTLPGRSHGATFTGACQTSLRDRFLDDPTRAPDTSCVAGMPRPNFVTDVYLQAGVLPFAQALQNGDPALLLPLGLILLVFLSALAGWPQAALRRSRGAQAASPAAGDRLLAAARWLAALVIVLDLVFISGLVKTILDTAAAYQPILLFGLPPSASPLFILPAVGAALTVGVAALAVAAWRRRGWTLAGRVHYALVALAAAGFVGVLWAWGLL